MYTTITVGRAYFGYVTLPVEITKQRNRGTRDLVELDLDLKYYKFDYYLKDMFFDSDTTVALLSTSPAVDPYKRLLSDDQMVATRNLVNRLSGTRRMFAHGIIWPSVPEYLEAMERAATELKVDSWKGYTVGDILGEIPSFEKPWLMDDEDLTYPTYEKARKVRCPNYMRSQGSLANRLRDNPKLALRLGG